MDRVIQEKGFYGYNRRETHQYQYYTRAKPGRVASKLYKSQINTIKF
jgi:hypothetical protein